MSPFSALYCSTKAFNNLADMHMVNTKTLQLSSFPSEVGVKYAILSHRWLQEPLEEVLYQDMSRLEQCTKLAGVDKLRSFCALAATMGYEWCWMDTCCIDKSSSAELSEAINSMYRWYHKAGICIAYLADVRQDVKSAKFGGELRQSGWFKRCWTLQELLAPSADAFFFYNASWQRLASKRDISRLLSEITGIDDIALLNGLLSNYSIAERMSWAALRHATRIEDEAYSLMGIFDINMSMLYGEGIRAFERLCETIIQYTNDETIFAWSADPSSHTRPTLGLLAPSPSYYRYCHGLKPMNLFHRESAFSLTSRGLTSTVMMTPLSSEGVHGACLNAAYVTQSSERFVAVDLRRAGQLPDEYVRDSHRNPVRTFDTTSLSTGDGLNLEPVKIFVRHRGHQKMHTTLLPHGIKLEAFHQLNLPHRLMGSSQSLTIAPGCEVKDCELLYRPSGKPNGPLCNIIPLQPQSHGIGMVQIGIHGDLFTSSPVVILLEEGKRAPKHPTGDLHKFKVDYSTVEWSVVGPDDTVESHSGFFALKIRDGCSVLCIRKTRMATKIGRSMVISYKFGVEAKLHSKDSQLLWEVNIVPVS